MIILSVNPSNETFKEFRLWNNLANFFKIEGHELIIVTTAYLSPFIQARHIRLPAKMTDLREFLVQEEEIPFEYSNTWWDLEDIRLIQEWEYLKWQLDQPSVIDSHDIENLMAFVSATVQELNPGLIITTNKVEPLCYLFKKAANACNIGYAFIERSPLDSIWIEKDGMFSESGIWSKFSSQTLGRNYLLEGEKAAQYLVANPYGLRANQEIERLTIQSARPYVLLIMDNILWTGWMPEAHPQRLSDYPLWPSVTEALLEIRDVCNAMNMDVLIRPHPADKVLTPILNANGLTESRADLIHLIHSSKCVLCFNSKVAFLVQALNHPMLILSPNPICAQTGTPFIRKKEELRFSLEHCLNESVPKNQEAFFKFLGWLSQDYFYSYKNFRKLGNYLLNQSQSDSSGKPGLQSIIYLICRPNTIFLNERVSYTVAKQYLDFKEWIIRLRVVRWLYRIFNRVHPLDYT